MDNGHDSDCATHNAPAYPAGPCDCMPTQAMCRAAVVHLNGADVYDKLPRDVLEIEESIYAEVWKAMRAAGPANAENVMKIELTKEWCMNMARLEDDAAERWSVDDVLLVVSTYGPWGADLNGVHKQEIILADEVLRLRESEKALAATLRDEMDEGLRLRELGGARPDEGIAAMTERIVSENAQLRAELARLDAAAKSALHAHTDWVDDDVRVRHPRA